MEAQVYLENALEIYRDHWGAVAKYEWLKEKKNELLAVPPTTNSTEKNTATFVGKEIKCVFENE